MCKEIENKISIRHNSEDRDLTYVEEHRKEIRECLEQAINNNEKLVSNSFRTKDINCDMETYKKNPEREG